MSQYEEVSLMAKMLFDRYGVIALDTKQVAEVLGKSEISLKQDRGAGIGLSYSKVGSLVKYSIVEVAKYLVATLQKTMA